MIKADMRCAEVSHATSVHWHRDPPGDRSGPGAFRGGLPGARWIDPEFYHITLRFIGDIDERMAREVYEVLEEGRRREPLQITIDSLDTFGGGNPARSSQASFPRRRSSISRRSKSG